MTTKLGVYIHIPFCNGKCAYCDFVSGVYPAHTQEAYFDMLKKEINGFDFSLCEVDTVYIGGGTPSSVDAGYIADVLGCINLAQNAEVTIECNPESFTREKAIQYFNSGINRISFGLQTASGGLLKKIGRLHSADDFIKAAAIAGEYFDNISVDLMLGLPGQTKEDVTTSIDFVLPHVSHISVYALKVEDGTPLAQSGYAPDEDFSADLYDIAWAKLKSHGYDRYEVSNFARGGKECRHNLKYWSLDEYKGFGVAAHSLIAGRREENTPSLADYLKGQTLLSSHKIEPGSDEDMEEFIMLALRTSRGIDLDLFSRRFGFRLENKKAAEIKKLTDYIKISSGRLSIKENGFYIMNKIIVDLL